MASPAAIALVLHAHIPFVLNHGRWPHGSDWLCEAAAEVYIPLLIMMRNLERDRVPFRLNLGLTPVLCEQLESDLFVSEFRAYLDHRIAAARDNERDFGQRGETSFAALAHGWSGYYQAIRHELDAVWQGRLLDGFRHFEKLGRLEILTCAATHPYLPLLGSDQAIQAQVRAGVAIHERHFGRGVRGFWLPECAYRPRGEWSSPVGKPSGMRRGLEEFIAAEGLKFFIVDTHMLSGGPPEGRYASSFGLTLKPAPVPAPVSPKTDAEKERSLHLPYWVENEEGKPGPLAVFSRDPQVSLVVWSGELGYPGDGAYLDFHKKHHPGGLRYWRVTDTTLDMSRKEIYELQQSASRVDEHAAHFSWLARRLLGGSRRGGLERPVLTGPFDAELFGHWWFEGMRWLEQVIRKIAEAPDAETVRLGDYLETDPPEESISLPEGSWGEGGLHSIWLNDSTKWMWRQIHEAEERMCVLAASLAEMDRKRDSRAAAMREVLAQAARSLMLLESSDWPFLVATHGAAEYAEGRFKRHADDFSILAGMAQSLDGNAPLSGPDQVAIRLMQSRDFIFPDVNPDWWHRSPDRN